MPRRAEIERSLASTLERMGDEEAASAAYAAALGRYGGAADVDGVLRVLAQMVTRALDPADTNVDRALALAESARNHVASRPEADLFLAQTNYRCGRLDDAAALAGAVLETAGTSRLAADSRLLLAAVRPDQRRPDEATELAETALRRFQADGLRTDAALAARTTTVARFDAGDPVGAARAAQVFWSLVPPGRWPDSDDGRPLDPRSLLHAARDVRRVESALVNRGLRVSVR